MKLKLTNSSLYKLEKEFGYKFSEMLDFGFTELIEISFVAREGEVTMEQHLKDVDELTLNELTDKVTKAVEEAFPKGDAEKN